MLDVLLNDVTTNQTHVKLGHSACSAVCKGLLCGMDLVDMACTHLFLGILLVPLMGLDGAQGPCPTPCHCTLEILNCSRITNPPGFHQVPLPNTAVHPHPFTYLDFTGNAISSTGKEVWNAYPWAEYLVLKDNSLSKLHNSSLEGLLSLIYLDLSCNKIQIIERNAFEAVPFLQIINLSGNIIEHITEGTFQAWHGMQFLFKVDLSHNPLAVIQDSYFYRLPSLKLLDLGATEVTPMILEDLLQTSLKLRTLILPKKMFCCLCRIKEDIEVSCETIKLGCTKSCAINTTLCEKEEPFNSIQEKVMKTLETRKLNGSSLLSILPERAGPNNDLLWSPEPNSDMLVPAPNYSNFTTNFNLLKSVKQVMHMKVDEPLDMNWTDKSELKRLYLLASLLEAAHKEKIMELLKDSPETTAQNELSAQDLEKSTDEATDKSVDISLKKERHVRKATRENWLRTNQRRKATLFRIGRDGKEFAKAAMQSADQPSDSELHNEAESQRKLVDSQHALSFLRPHQEALQSSWKRSISDSLTNALNPTGSVIVDKNNNDLTSLSSDGNYVAVLGNGHGIQILTKEELLNKLLHRSNPPAGDDKSKISAINSEPSLNELSSDITLSHGTDWEYQRTSVSPPRSLAPQDDFFRLRDIFEADLNKKLASLIPNTPVRKLLSHLIRILQMDCTAPTVQMACAKLLSRTGLLMKLFSENVNETSSLWKSYFWPSKNVSNMTTASSRNLEKPLGMTASQGIPEHGYRKKMVLALSVTAILMVIIVAICVIEICSQRSAAKDRTFLGRVKKPLPDEELSRTGSLLMDKPPELKDQPLDETQEGTVDNLHYEDSSEGEDILSWGEARPSFPEPTPKKSLSVQTSSVKKGSEETEGTSEAISSKAASLAPDEEGDDKEEEEEEEEAAESGEGDEEDEEED
ncbi:UNVERIFIED_CONTAM: hypothetical protein K2H54_034239 [Gekko kuhli]